MTEFLESILLPRSWGTEHPRAFKSSQTNDTFVPALKAHSNHVFVGSGLLAVCAAWPRGEEYMNNQRIREFAVCGDATSPSYDNASPTYTDGECHRLL